MRQLLAGFVPGLPDSTLDAIVGRADGMPLYAVELVRSLVADGRIALVDGVYRLTGELGSLTVPDTLRSLIASRLDTLEASDRSLVADAAILGQVFTIGGLAAVSGLDPSSLEPRLRSLVRLQLFDVEMDPGSPERGQHRFVQGLIREVAYATLARRDRRDRHLAAARYYESLGDDELAGALASHFVSAHAASDPGAEADALAVQARLALSAAADRAVTLGAHDQAVLHLRAAIPLAGTQEERGDLLLRAATSASAAARHVVAEEFAREAVSVAQSTANAEALGHATALLGEILIDTGQAEGAAMTLEESIASLTPGVSDITRADLYRTLSHALMRTGAAERCVDAADEALRIAEPLGLELIIAEALNNKASALGYVGRQRECLALMRGAVEVARSGGYVAAEIRALFNLSATVQDIRESRDICTEAVDLATRVGNRALAIWATETNRLNAHVLGEGWDEALAIDQARDAGPGREGLSDVDVIRSLFSSGLLLGARGESTDALIDRMAPLAATVADPVGPSSLHLLTAERALLAGDYPTAFVEGIAAAGWADMAPFFMALIVRAALWSGDVDRAMSARSFCETVRTNDAFVAAARHAADGAVAALEGRDAEAVVAFVAAIGGYRAVHGDYFAALTALDLLIAVGPGHAVAREAAAEARELLERVGATPYLRRLDEALNPETPGDRAAIPAMPRGAEPVG
jgi:tetratricopeptide (TPR) repeat protein